MNKMNCFTWRRLHFLKCWYNKTVKVIKLEGNDITWFYTLPTPFRKETKLLCYMICPEVKENTIRFINNKRQRAFRFLPEQLERALEKLTTRTFHRATVHTGVVLKHLQRKKAKAAQTKTCVKYNVESDKRKKCTQNTISTLKLQCYECRVDSQFRCSVVAVCHKLLNHILVQLPGQADK